AITQRGAGFLAQSAARQLGSGSPPSPGRPRGQGPAPLARGRADSLSLRAPALAGRDPPAHGSPSPPPGLWTGTAAGKLGGRATLLGMILPEPRHIFLGNAPRCPGIAAMKLPPIKLEEMQPTSESAPRKSLWTSIHALAPVIMTVLATILAGLSSSDMTRAQYHRSLASQNQSKAAHQWR